MFSSQMIEIYLKKNTLIIGLMAAILDFTRKRGFPQEGFGWSLMCDFI